MYACGPVLYSNVGQNVPLLQEKGEFSGQIAYSETAGSWSASGVMFQGAYAVSDKVGIISSYYGMSDVDDPDNEWDGSGSYFELGGGIYGGKPEKKFLYEAYGGIGFGSIRNKSLIVPHDYIDVHYLKPFIQPSFGFSTKYFDMALTPRIAYLGYTSQDDYLFAPSDDPYDPQEFFENSNKVVFEPGILVRGGFPGVKLEIQYNFSTIQEQSEDYFVNNEEHLSIGLRFLLSERTTGKEKK